jgi:ATP-binding cassette subfamily B protein
LRSNIIEKISHESYSYTQEKTPSLLLTNLTSDVDAIRQFIAVAMPALIAAIVTLFGAAGLILYTDWKLGIWVLSIIPIIAVAFGLAFSKLGSLFKRTQEIIDTSNRVINNSIIGAALIRVLHSGKTEEQKFEHINAESRDVGMRILTLFSSLIPIVMFASNIASLAILYVGGSYVIKGGMSFGTFAAFNTYVSILILPIFIIGFTTSAIGKAKASIVRIQAILDTETKKSDGTITDEISGNFALKNISLSFGSKKALDNISFEVKAGQKIAILGPTGGGKTQLLNIMAGLTAPDGGVISYDNHRLADFDRTHFYKYIGLVFQDSILFNLNLRENIAFGGNVDQVFLDKAIHTAGLSDFVNSLPKGLDTLVSERGMSLSGGQKQRIMLARALTKNPKVLFLDDFTARVDASTEHEILHRLETEFPEVTLVSVTQKIASVEEYDAIIVLVEGELVAMGTHEELLHTSPEYVQIYESQKSTIRYELQS